MQNEVSSLLEFKNALLETFPHLHNRFGGSVSPSSGGIAAPTPIPGIGGGLGGSTSPMKSGLSGIIHPQQHVLHHTSSAPNVNNAISATSNHSQRISSPSPAGMGRMSSPVAVGPNHLTHYNPSNNNGSSRQHQPIQQHQTGFENINQHIIDQQQQDIHENSWDQNQHQPHNQSGLVPVPPALHGPVVIGSSNTGTLPRRPGGSKPPVVIRKSPENSNSSSGSGSHLSNTGTNGGGGGGTGGGGGIAADSGFNSETKDMAIPLSTNGLPPTLIR